MDIIKIALMGIAGVFLAIMVRSYKSEYSLFISMAVCTCIFIYLVSKLELILSYVDSIQSLVVVDNRYVKTVIKMIGITYIAEFSVDMCKDAGYQAIAGQIEMFAKMSILLISMPVLMSFVETIGEFL
jgi:stage III sporulation protein AD